MFEYDDFEETTVKLLLCATTRKQDRMRIRLFVVVEPYENKLWYEVHCNKFIEKRKYFKAALQVFNVLN